MINHKYFENIYHADPDRWDHWTDFCWWLEENVFPGVERIIDIHTCELCHHPDEVECECGEVIYL